MNSTKTILITCFHAFIPRNILRTKVLDILTSIRGAQIVVAVPEHKKNHYEKMFQDKKVIITGIKVNQPSRYFFGLLFKRIFANLHGSETVALLQEEQRTVKKKVFYYFLFLLPMRLLWHSPYAVRSLRFLDLHLSPTHMARPLFDMYGPDLIFATDVDNENDVAFIQEAKRRKIPVVGMVRSWDKLTWRLIRIVPDKLLVWSNTRKEEATQLHYVAQERIMVTGIPHYDRYLSETKMSRADFFKLIGLDPAKKLILCAMVGDFYMRKNTTDRYILELLSGLKDVNVIVRFPITDTVANVDDFIPKPHMHINRPGVNVNNSKLGEREISDEDDRFLMNALFYSDLVISGPSTIPLDAAFFDRPIMLINFHPEKKDYWDGIVSYNYTHVRSLVGSGGARLIESRGDFFEWINKYLADSHIDEKGRGRIVEEQCGPRDGRSSERVARAVIEMLR